MGLIGRWIDSLTDHQRDRIIEHPDPTYDGGAWWSRYRNCGCLVGCTVDEWGHTLALPVPLTIGPVVNGYWEPDRNHIAFKVGNRFPAMTERFTPERMWRVVKARAARANRIALPALEPATMGESE